MAELAAVRRERRHYGNLSILLFLLAQGADGALTYFGVRTLGLGMEGNPLLLALMVTIGAAPTVFGAKVMAAMLGISLHLIGVHRIVAALTAFYVFGAVLPWMGVFVTRL